MINVIQAAGQLWKQLVQITAVKSLQWWRLTVSKKCLTAQHTHSIYVPFLMHKAPQCTLVCITSQFFQS